MEHAGGRIGERRQAVRLGTPLAHGIVLARVRPGHEAEVLDVSVTGILIETARRLLPGSMVDLHLETQAHRAAVRGRVVRCTVAALLPARIWYRGAIGFDHPLTWLSESLQPRGGTVDRAGLRHSSHSALSRCAEGIQLHVQEQTEEEIR